MKGSSCSLSSMASKIIIVVFHILICLEFCPAKAQTWIKAGYWLSDSEVPVSSINSTLFTHLYCGLAGVNPTSYELTTETQFSNFTDIVKQQNPTVTTLLSIGGWTATNFSDISSLLVSNPSYRKSFIDSSISLARLYGFQGLDFFWASPNSSSSDKSNMGILFKEWRAAIDLEASNSNQSQLILTAAVYALESEIYPIDSMEEHLNWTHFIAYNYYKPDEENFTRAHAALHDPSSTNRTDYAITAWINGGLSAYKLVLGLPFHGYAWTLVNSENNGIGAPATGPAISKDGWSSYKEIKEFIEQNGVSNFVYNATYVVNYCSIGTSWIGFDDAEAVRAKVSYAKEKNLGGYYVWDVSNDDQNWVLSQAAAAAVDGQEDKSKDGQSNWRLLVSVLTPIAAVILLLGFSICYCRIRKLKSSKGRGNSTKGSKTGGDFDSNVPNLMVYSFVDIEAATNKFSFEKKLGEGGYGPVYKGVLEDGQEIAVKKLSKTSKQGFEEFKNEVMLTAKLQHVNLVRVLGFCIDREEQMLIYEYMPNKSLDYYLFDPIERLILDWNKRVDIIEGVCQGLLYLQEYSRLTIIHRDIKASNILLDENMKPKISDFGMARIFAKDDFEANTERIVGTNGYIPPEYARRGIYSIKSDVYSFGVLFLQIISGKKVFCLFGENESLSLLEYAYQLWRDGKGMEFMDCSLDDTGSSCKLLKCLQIALLCVQEVSVDRPTMLEVSSMLKNETTNIMIPKKPAFWKQTNEIEENKSTPQPVLVSLDDATITEVVPR